ncbi:MAG: M12 family metallo-peptidase [Nocardioides sp.]
MTAQALPRGRRLGALLALALVAAVLPVTFAPGPAPAATPARGAAPLFERLAHFTPARGETLRVHPRRSTAYRVDLGGVRSTLAAAPTAAAVRHGAAPLRFSVPDPAGHLERFAVERVSVMQAGLAARHPEIRTYAGRGLTDPGSTIRLDVTPMGFHVSVRDVGVARTWYVDPAYDARGTTTHLSYVGASVPAPERFVERDLLDSARSIATGSSRTAPGAEVVRRTYRLAFLTDPTYAAYFGSANVLAEKATLINRVDQVYNDDLAIRFVLIDATDRLNLDTKAKATAPHGPCGASACFDPAAFYPDGTAGDTPDGCTGALLTRNEFVLGQLVGADSFDVGHIGLGVNGGGIAGLGVVGGASKADGCTGLPFPKGDFYAVDYVAHEMGHQMGGNHTFNGDQDNCSTLNRNGGTSVEPGSGSSVMAYAGICGQDDLQSHSDPYFSQRSIDEITATTGAAPGTENEQQTVTLSGFDTDGDSFQLTYPGHAPVTVTRGGTGYTALQVSSQIFQLTGCRPTLTGYDSSSPQLNDGGFTAAFTSGTGCRGTDLARMGVGTTTGGVSGFVGVPVDGGPDTNRGVSDQTGNHAPTVVAPADRTIPLRTPFTLTGSGSDTDAGTSLTYLWEQDDVGSINPLGGTALVDNTKSDGPLFRVFGVRAQVADPLTSPAAGENLADGSPTRTFPDLAQVLAGNTNARTGTCPAAPADTTAAVPPAVVDCYSEFLPTSDYDATALARTLDFRLTARDGFPSGGGTAYDDVTLTVDPSAGPFLVTSRATAGSPAAGGGTETVTWDVAGTATAALAPNVSISLSTDGGQTWPYQLAASTPNDGSQAVTLPSVDTDQARIRVSAVGNYFFDVNDATFSIRSPFALTPPLPDQTVQYGDPLADATTTATSGKVDGDQLVGTLTGVPGLGVARQSTSAPGVRPGTATFAPTGTADAAPGPYTGTLSVTEGTAPGAAVATDPFAVTVTPEDATAAYTGPATAETPVGQSTVDVPLSAHVGQAADGHPGDLTTASVTFTDRATGGTLCTSPVDASGDAACTATLSRTGASTTYTIGTVVGGRFARDSAADDATVTVTAADGSDTTPPQTRVTAGPGAFLLASRATVRYAADEAGSTFACTLDGQPVACGSARVTLAGLGEGTHVFTVAARDSSGNTDPTPARRVFAVPVGSAHLQRLTDGWRVQRSAAAYEGRYLRTTRPGRALGVPTTRLTRLAVVVDIGSGYGRLAVYVGSRRVGVVDLDAPRAQGPLVLDVARFRTPVSGRVRLVTLDGAPVRVEGVGLLEKP